MAGRDIKIPFGPDRTGGFDLSNLVPEVEPSNPDEQYAGEFDEQAEQATESLSREGLAALADNAAADDAVSDDARVLDSETAEGDEAGIGVVAAGAFADAKSSLAALKDSFDQGRELKAREKERDAFSEKLAADHEELEDRENILTNYADIVAEQDDIMYEASQERDARKAELSQILAQQEETSDALARMRDFHDSELQPIESALGRARATAEQAKNDERSRKSELSAAETEKRRAEGGEDAAVAAAKYELVAQAHEEASARSEAAKDALAKVQRQYDELKEQIAQAEAPLERSLEDMSNQADELKDVINQLGETISAARKRRQYCDNVYQYPEETEKLRASVESDEETVHQMDVENDELRDMLAESKERSKLAKIGIIVLVAVIIILIILFAFVLR